jgi:hypothetical protein
VVGQDTEFLGDNSKLGSLLALFHEDLREHAVGGGLGGWNGHYVPRRLMSAGLGSAARLTRLGFGALRETKPQKFSLHSSFQCYQRSREFTVSGP